MARALLSVLLGVLFATPSWASGGTCESLPGSGIGDMSVFWVIPFAGLLLSIAVVPMVAGHWWHHNRNQLLTSLGWASPVLVYLGYLAFADSGRLGCEAGTGLVHAVIEYVSFIALLGSLFVISGGILLKGDLQGKPYINTAFLLVGAVICNLIGTTGASMLLIQPMLRTNAARKNTWHIPLFFIFLVSNVGGSLTPIGDPPLFLGYLRGVPFEWTLTHLWWIWVPTVGLLLATFFVLDTWQYGRESAQVRQSDARSVEPLGLEGSVNFLLLGGVIAAVLLLSPVGHAPKADDHSGDHHGALDLMQVAPQIVLPTPAYAEPPAPAGVQAGADHGTAAGAVASAAHHDEGGISWDPRDWFLREIAMVALAVVSMWVTSRRIRERNKFEFGPIIEVAALFVGIFVAMVPATAMLQANGAALGLKEPWQFFWATGALSAFLDNAPTYVTFASVACGIDPTCVTPNDLSPLALGPSATILMAISLGSVFLGAGSYIGNGPNFMVRAIAENYTMEVRSKGADGTEMVETVHPYKMPSFFAYIGYAALFLGPVFIPVSFVCFYVFG